MSLKDALVAGLDAVPECQTICYVDMSSGLVLASQGRSRRPQEFYDKIASLAASFLQSPTMAEMAKSMAIVTEPESSPCICLFGGDQTHVFVKAKSFPEHAICYMCSPTVNPDALSAAVMENREIVANAM